ncbi:uncharacterized protein LOC133175790 [Saccostrea echinata]|uniref:uncharacterized protein LOC133175790 n=1 Tax=Saccostrea echinata TaxID=191078 RepID=UPI002A827B59|nr:uncharacterized protein LOC133175790 [Saccostrea echinata]
MTFTTEKDGDFIVNWNDNNYNDAQRREHVRRHLQHMPYISNANNQKMVVWTDFKEIFFPSCTKNCDIVLRELKSILNYPKSEKFMHPCTPRDHVAFLRQFRYVSIGTLLVQINKLDYGQVSLWERVLKKHISTSNDRPFCCSPATKSHSPVHEEVSFTITKFQKTFVDTILDKVISSQEFLVPALDEDKSQTGNIRRYIPLHILGNIVPIVRKRLVDFCGRNVVKFDNTISRCCSAAEAREITTWQYNRQGGWGGQWRHLTTRDLLVSFTSCMKFLNKYCKDLNVTQTADNEIKIKMESGVSKTEDLTRAFKVSFKEVKTNPERLPHLFPNLYCNYQEQTPKATSNGSTSEYKMSKATLEKKRQRIKSPRDGPDIKWECKETSNQGKTLMPTNSSTENVNKSNVLPDGVTASSAPSNSFSETGIIKGGHANSTVQQRSPRKSINCPEINQSKEPPACSKSGRLNSVKHKLKKFKNQSVDDKTLMDLVSSNPFRHSIESLKAIRELNMERQKKESDIRTNKTTDHETMGKGYVQEKSESKTGSKPKWSKNTVVLPVIPGTRKLKTVSKDTSNQKVRSFESTNNFHDRKKHLSSRSNLKETENENYDKGTKKHASLLKNCSDATIDLSSTETFYLAKTTHVPTSDKTQSSECGQSDTKSQCFSENNLGRAQRDRMETSGDSARGLVNQVGKNIVRKTNQTCLQNITKKRVSFEGGGIIQQNITGADYSLPRDRRDSSKGIQKLNNKGVTYSTLINAQQHTGLKIVSAQGSKDRCLNSVEVCKTLEKERPRSDVKETTVYAVDVTQTKIATDTFHPKKRWAKDFLSIHRDQKSTMADVQQNKVGSKALEQNKKKLAIGQNVQETEKKQNTPYTVTEKTEKKQYTPYTVTEKTEKKQNTPYTATEKTEIKQNTPYTATEETEKKQNTPYTVTEETVTEARHVNKMVSNGESVDQAINKNVTELFLLQDSNVDHEEVIDEKLREDVIVMNESDLSLYPQETDFVSETDFNDKFRVDTSTGDDVVIIYYKTNESKEMKKEKPDESKSSHELQDTRVNSLTEESGKTKKIHTDGKGSKSETATDVDPYIETEIGDSESSHLDAKKGKNLEKSKKRRKNSTEKKAKKGRKRKPKAAKSACSVDCKAEELQKAIRIQNVIEEQKRILDILTRRKPSESRIPPQNNSRRCQSVSENELIDMEAGFSRGTPSSTPVQLLEKVKQSDDSGRKKGIRIKRKNKIEIKQEGEGAPLNSTESQILSSISTGNIYPALGIDIFDIGYDVFRDDSGTETGGLVLHPGFVLPYVLVNGFQYIALADAHKLFPGCRKNCKILRNTLKKEPALQLTYCTWEQLYVLDLIFFAKGRRLVTGDPMIRCDILIGRYQDLLWKLTIEQAGQSDQPMVDASKIKTENINSVYQSYVQYPTTGQNSNQQQQAAPVNQPKLSNKNPVMHINELRKGLVYDISTVTTTEENVIVKTEASQTEDGPGQTLAITPETASKKKKKQETAYSCNVKVDGEIFTGTGRSQRCAKLEACKYALLKKFNILYVPGYENLSEESSIFTGIKRKNPGAPNVPKPKKQKSSAPKNALMVLNERNPGLSYNVVSQTGPVHAPTFVISVEIDGQTFTGTGTSKKSARLAAAQNACNALNLEYVS